MDAAINLCNLWTKFGDDKKCREYLEALGWPDGVRCSGCDPDKISGTFDRGQFDCDSCRYQFSVTAGRIFHDSHLPPVKWFATTYLLCESRKGMSANPIKRMMGISYKTAWYLCHRIRATMKELNPEPMTGTVEVDETYAGGKPKKGSKRGGGTPKQTVIGIRQRSGALGFFHAQDVKSGTLGKYIKENVSGDVDVIVTDDFSATTKPLENWIPNTQPSITVKVIMLLATSTRIRLSLLSLLKRGVTGTWHKLRAKHLQAYCNEMCSRFDNRKNPYLLRETLIKMLGAENIEYKELIAERDDFEAAQCFLLSTTITLDLADLERDDAAKFEDQRIEIVERLKES